MTDKPRAAAVPGNAEADVASSPSVVNHLAQQYLSGRQKFSLAYAPTPLQRLDRLSQYLRGPTIWLKREDLVGPALGGNKIRKLEYLLGDALSAGVQTLVTVGALQSNHVRQTAAAAAMAGLACEAVLVEAVDNQTASYVASGNVLLDELLGANIHKLSASRSAELFVAKLMARLTLQGRKPRYIPLGGSNAVGSLGHVEMLGELLEQHAAIDAIYLASSSGGTQAGLMAGLALAGREIPVHGISVYQADTAKYAAAMAKLASAALRKLKVKQRVAASELQLSAAYLGEGYGVPTESGIEAIRLLARLEGVLLDPVYTGKAMAALIDDVRRGRYRADQHLVFVHTGGAPGLFAYVDAL